MYCMKYSNLLVDLMNKEVDVYEANSNNVSSKRAILAHQLSTICEWIFKCGLALYACAGMFYLVNPLYSYFWLNEIVPVMPIFMPFIDENTQTGFVQLTIIHLVFITTSVIGSGASDFMFILLIFNMIFLARILTDNANELNAILRKDKVDRRVAKAKLVNILLMHREIFEYVLYILF